MSEKRKPDVGDSAAARKRQRMQSARVLAVQPADAALSSREPGSLDVSAFVAARAFEIQALEAGMRASRAANTTRAFQTVPRALRRRGASHEVRRVPARLRARARREILEDNTPTGTARRRRMARRPRRHKAMLRMRLRQGALRVRLERARRRQAANGQLARGEKEGEKEKGKRRNKNKAGRGDSSPVNRHEIAPRVPKLRANMLARPPRPAARFAKRQRGKVWLPTHLFHAKRAHMTSAARRGVHGRKKGAGKKGAGAGAEAKTEGEAEAEADDGHLWGFALPLSPTERCYRATHRAAGARGAIAWDMSYMATVGAQGTPGALEGVLRGLGVGVAVDGKDEPGVWGLRGRKWRAGLRALDAWVYEPGSGIPAPIAPVTILWSASAPVSSNSRNDRQRQLFLRIHPSAFPQLWACLLPLACRQHPPVRIDDLRFEIGSIEVTGPGATEALRGALWPVADWAGEKKEKGEKTENGEVTMTDADATTAMTGNENALNAAASTWTALPPVVAPASLPAGVVLAFSIADPRLQLGCDVPVELHQPGDDDAGQRRLATLLSEWPPDMAAAAAAAAAKPAAQPQPAPAPAPHHSHLQSTSLFSRPARLAAQRALPSQKAIGRRRAAAGPGRPPAPKPETDPRIPVAVIAARNAGADTEAGNGTYTVLLPWSTVQPVWYALLFRPLSSASGGGQPRFGALAQTRQLAAECRAGWFPGDFAGTAAGWAWGQREDRERGCEWERKPTGKRVEFGRVDVGDRRGEGEEGKEKTEKEKGGEVGRGWACDWEVLAGQPDRPQSQDIGRGPGSSSSSNDNNHNNNAQRHPFCTRLCRHRFQHLSPSQARAVLTGTLRLPGPSATAAAKAEAAPETETEAEVPLTFPIPSATQVVTPTLPSSAPAPAPTPAPAPPHSTAATTTMTTVETRTKKTKSETAETPASTSSSTSTRFLATVRLTLLGRGAPSPCARIYRLPPGGCGGGAGAGAKLRGEWVRLAEELAGAGAGGRKSGGKGKGKGVGEGSYSFSVPDSPTLSSTSTTITTTAATAAASAATDATPITTVPAAYPPHPYPATPPPSDLVGFVTAGGFNLACGRGTAVGCVELGRLMMGGMGEEAGKNDAGSGSGSANGKANGRGRGSGKGRGRSGTRGIDGGRLCVVREAGQRVCRVAVWELV